MLEDIRESSQGLTAKIILGFIILTFAVAGIGSYTNSVDTSVAEVNGEKISKSDFDKAYQSQRNRMAQQFGEMFETLSADANYMNNFRNGVLDNLINERLIDQSTDDMAIRISDERLKNTIRQMPEFQVDGVFDNNRYLAIINQAGFFQSSDFRDYLRVEMTRRQLTQALIGTEFSLPYQEEMIASLQNQKRDIRFATISAQQFRSTIELTDDEISQYYADNQDRFQTQEKVKVNYLTLDVNEIAKTIVVTDADVESYYQENISNYTQAEQRQLAHILIEFNDDEDAAKTKIDALLARINAGEDFAALAKEFSADTYSGENGGDLDWMERGVMDEVFDEKAFALPEVGSISDVVKTEFGFHIIKVLDIKPEHTKPLSEVRDELFTKISENQAQDKFFELQQEMARLSFEFPDNLDDAAGAINGSVKTSDWLSRGANATPFNEPKVIDAAFSDLVLTDQVNSDVIEINDDLAIVVRLNEYQPATIKPLSDVEAQIKETLIAQKASDQAKSLADELLAKFNAGEDISAQLAEISASFELKSDITRNSADIDRSISNKAFTLPHPAEGQISAATVTTSKGDIALLEVQAVKEGEITVDANLGQQLVSQLAQSAYGSYVEALKVDAQITRKALNETVTQY
ncbi:SurA N-terminal domain-containing protein [Colwelliaceae bacterium 6471]